jgi:hypothetical protein
MFSMFLLKLSETAIGMNKNLCISINSLIKLLVSSLRFINIDLMRNNKTGLGPARNDKIT